MKHFLIVMFVTLLFFRCSDRDSSMVFALENTINNRVETLSENYRYLMLKSSGEIIDFEVLLDSFDKIQSVNEMNTQIKIISDTMRIKLYTVESSNFHAITLLNKLIILDEIINKANVTNVKFSDVQPLVYVTKETLEETEFNIVLAAKDRLFNPEFELMVGNDTFLLNVDDLGKASFTMQKKSFGELPVFSGNAVFYTDGLKVVRKPFSFK